MKYRPAHKYDFARWLFLTVAGSVSVAFGQPQLPATRPEFEVSSVKPNVSGRTNFLMRPSSDGRFTATNVTLKQLIALGYQLRETEVFGGPAWIGSDRYDVAAQAADRNVNTEQSRVMIQRMLEDRFALKVHREKKALPILHPSSC